MKISGSYVICIKKFLQVYLNHEYEDTKKLTHYYLMEYLQEKSIMLPKRLNIKNISKEDILIGKVLFVRDESNKIIPYNNPMLFNNSLLLSELKSKRNVEKSKQNRREYLKSKGLIEGKNGELVKISDTIEEVYSIEHNNRYKKQLNRKLIKKVR